MRHALSNIARWVMFPCVVATALGAQDSPLRAELKVRTGIAVAAPEDNLSRKTLGFGLNLNFTTKVGVFGAELGYTYKPGDMFLVDLTKAATAPGAPAPDPNFSADSRKNNLDGLMLRLSYARAFSEGWSFQAGLQVGNARFRHEYIADIGDTDWATYEDTYNSVVTKSKLSVSPYVGVQMQLGKDSAIEANLVLQRYTSIHYNHVAGTAKPYAQDRLSETSRSVPHVEFGYAFRF